MKNKLTLLAILLCSAFIPAKSQTVTRGISNGQITVIEIGNSGDVWVGTADSGAVHYSSNLTFINEYTNLGDVNAIALASVGGASNAYIGSTTGLTDVKTGSAIAASGSVLPEASISSLVYKSDSGLLYVFTPDAGGVVLDSTMQYHNALSLPFSKITCAFQSGCGAGYVAGSLDSGAFYTTDFTTYNTFQNLVNDSVTAVYITNNCNAYIVGTRYGFSFCPDGHPCRNYTVANSVLPEDYITAISQDCHGNTWIGMKDSGAVIFEPDSVPQLFTRVNLPAGTNQVTTLASQPDSCNGTYTGAASGYVTLIDSPSVTEINTAVQQVTENTMQVKIFPQPASGQVNFAFTNALQNAQFSFTDLTGRTLCSYDIKNTNQLTLDVSTLADGLYLYRVLNNGAVVNAGRFEVVR